MAFGFPAYHEEALTLPGWLTHDHVMYACRAAGLGNVVWGMGVWRASGSVSFTSWGEEVTLTPLAPNVVRIRSQGTMPTQCFDWGKNESNVRRIASALWHSFQMPPAPPYR